MPDLVYPRKISITRAQMTNTPADGFHQSEIPVLTDVPASIQLAADRSAGARVSPGPTDSNDAVPVWNIFIPAGAAELGVVRLGDKVVDDTGMAYRVEAPYWNILGYRLSARLYNPTGKSTVT